MDADSTNSDEDSYLSDTQSALGYHSPSQQSEVNFDRYSVTSSMSKVARKQTFVDKMTKALYSGRPDEIASKLYLMTQAWPLCGELREYGYLAMLVELLHRHSSGGEMLSVQAFLGAREARHNAAIALQNILHATNASESRIEIKINQMLTDLRSFVEVVYEKQQCESEACDANAIDHPIGQMVNVIRVTCEKEPKRILDMLGGIYVITDVRFCNFSNQ